MQKLILATRSSPLAMWQAKNVAQNLEKGGFEIEFKAMETVGDKKLDVTLSKIGDKGVFTIELESLLLDGQAHLAVHSAKDMPSNLPEGLEILAFTKRENPIDVVVSKVADFHLENRKMVLGTSSTRRVATLKRHFPEIETVPVRGNLQTRIRKMMEGECDALILAYAGVYRMGFENLITQNLDISVFTPAVGQGALAIETSVHLPVDVKNRIHSCLNHLETNICVEAERSFLRTMEGGCSVPVFAYAHLQNSTLSISGGIISLDGLEEVRNSLQVQMNTQDPDSARKLGFSLANSILSSGGYAILQKIKQTLRP
jgi:hydroxymethylbilane synthase